MIGIKKYSISLIGFFIIMTILFSMNTISVSDGHIEAKFFSREATYDYYKPQLIVEYEDGGISNTITIFPWKDTYVDFEHASTSYGSSNVMKIGNTYGNPWQKVLLNFPIFTDDPIVAGLILPSVEIIDATLQMYVFDITGPLKIECYRFGSGYFNEGESWNEFESHSTAYFPTPMTYRKITSSDEDSLVTWDVTEIVESWQSDYPHNRQGFYIRTSLIGVGDNVWPILDHYDSWTDGIDPNSGDVSTTFDFKVHYFDEDGDSPSVKQVFIDGTPYVMSGSGSDDDYSYSASGFSDGSHSYYFYFEDGNGGSDQLPSSGSWSFTVDTNHNPQLSYVSSWTDGVNPDYGPLSTNFQFKVHYLDEDGDNPSVKNVVIDGISYPMSGSGSDNNYIFSKNDFSKKIHQYYFYFEDGKGGTVRLPDSDWLTFEVYSGNPPSKPELRYDNIDWFEGNDQLTSTIKLNWLVGGGPHYFRLKSIQEDGHDVDFMVYWGDITLIEEFGPFDEGKWTPWDIIDKGPISHTYTDVFPLVSVQIQIQAKDTITGKLSETAIYWGFMPVGAASFMVHSPVDLHIYDVFGRHVGMNYSSGEFEIGIPGALVTQPLEPQQIIIPNPIKGSYNVTLIGTGTGNYTLDIIEYIGNDIVDSDVIEDDISLGEHKSFDSSWDTQLDTPVEIIVDEVLMVGTNATVNISIWPTQPLTDIAVSIIFNSSLLTVNSILEGDLFNSVESTFHGGSINHIEGVISGICSSVNHSGDYIINPGCLATLYITVGEESGDTELSISDLIILNISSQPVSVDICNASVFVMDPLCSYVDDDFDDTTPGWGIDHFTLIQEGIDAVNENGTVYVSNGIYSEIIEINKSISIVGEDMNHTIVRGNIPELIGHLIGDGGFYAKEFFDEFGVVSICGDNITISHMTIEGMYIFTWMAGVYVSFSENCSINHCKLQNFSEGCFFKKTINSHLLNSVFFNDLTSVYMLDSHDNIVYDNDMVSQFGFQLLSSSNNLIKSNEIIGMPMIIDWSDSAGITFDFYSNFNTIEENNIKDFIFGMKIGEEIDEGIHNNTIRSNRIVNNSFGIVVMVEGIIDNMIYNNYFDNIYNAIDEGMNQWHTSLVEEVNIINGPFIGGNYWSDYHGMDIDGNGIGEAPYPIYNGNQDVYPLSSMEEYQTDLPFLSWYPNAKIPQNQVTMNVTDGVESYFDITLSNVPDGFHVTNGVYHGWCFEKEVQMTREMDHLVRMCHSYDPNMPNVFRNANWSMINYVINNKGGSSNEVIQEAIWAYIEGIEPTSAEVITFMEEVSMVASDFYPTIGDKIAVLVWLDDTAVDSEGYPPVQNTFIEVPLSYMSCPYYYWTALFSDWPFPMTRDDSVGDYFNLPSMFDIMEEFTLQQILEDNVSGIPAGIVGNCYKSLLKEAIIGLVNAHHPCIHYPISHDQIIVSMHTSFSSIQKMMFLQMVLEIYNIIGCSCEGSSGCNCPCCPELVE